MAIIHIIMVMILKMAMTMIIVELFVSKSSITFVNAFFFVSPSSFGIAGGVLVVAVVVIGLLGYWTDNVCLWSSCGKGNNLANVIVVYCTLYLHHYTSVQLAPHMHFIAPRGPSKVRFHKYSETLLVIEPSKPSLFQAFG